MTQLERIAQAIADLTGATGPDRAIDGLIEVACHPTRETILYNEPGPFPQKSVRGPISQLVLTGKDLAEYIGAPHYTESYDAAMKLAGCDDHRRIEFGTIEPGNGWAYAHLDDDAVGEAEGCANEPIAITVALLQCIAARLEAQGKETAF